jgi:bacterioferritin
LEDFKNDRPHRLSGLTCTNAALFPKPWPPSPALAARADGGPVDALEISMKGDIKVIEYLNRGLKSEITAINQYWLHYRMLDNWGLKDMAKTWRKESIEEMEHADKFVTRILFLEGLPNLQHLEPLRIGQDVKEVIAADLAAEIGARALYQEAAAYCDTVKDYPSRDLFIELMTDEEGHIDFLETQLDLIERIGLPLYTQNQVGELGD